MTMDTSDGVPEQVNALHIPKLVNERLCIGGHRETIFGIAFSPDGEYLATASQDSTVRIWETNSNRLVTTLSEGMSIDFECLRVAWMKPSIKSAVPTFCNEKYVLASAGADGIVRLWSAVSDVRGKLMWKLVDMIDHCKHIYEESDGIEENDRPQIYSLQFIQRESSPELALLMTSAGDSIYLWNIESDDTEQNGTLESSRKFSLFHSMQFSHVHSNSGVFLNQFGGARNPDNELYVFDAAYSDTNDLIGAAISDGTCRILSPSYRGETESMECDSTHKENCVLTLPSDDFPGLHGGHLTALSWDKSGTRLATCIACGKVVLWRILSYIRDGLLHLHPTCVAILEGGHDVGRPLFGARYYGEKHEEFVVSWGVDGKICVWSSFAVGKVDSPLGTLITHSGYPIYSLDFTQSKTGRIAQSCKFESSLALGGGSDGGFLGVPAYIYDIQCSF